MVTVKIYGMLLSPYAQTVMVTCNELGINYELIVVDLIEDEQKLPEFIEKQPFAAVPVFVDEDGTQLYESRAICRYLVAKYGRDSGLVPDPNDLKASALFEQAASIEYSVFDPHARALIFQRVFARYIRLLGVEPDEAIAQRSIATLNSKMEGYERILSKQKYLAGDSFTLADLLHLGYGKFVFEAHPSIFLSKPSVKRWWEDITSRATNASWKAFQLD
ncbi:unnamed protein product [Rhizoctonia solani]|uniref:glutathione transferase n=1 Tax=Rhizoctonia solani TaxID=456999 RepID=A0A8H3BB90_9AGAM|nr:unnamed protein product [Rhizoctonia solani]